MTKSDQSTTTRTLRRLKLPARFNVPDNIPVRQGLYVDCETTGKDWARDAVIEIALLPFAYTLDGHIVEVRLEEAHSYRRDPGRALSAETTALTGLTDDDVRGRHIDVEAASALTERSDLRRPHRSRRCSRAVRASGAPHVSETLCVGLARPQRALGALRPGFGDPFFTRHRLSPSTRRRGIAPRGDRDCLWCWQQERRSRRRSRCSHTCRVSCSWYRDEGSHCGDGIAFRAFDDPSRPVRGISRPNFRQLRGQVRSGRGFLPTLGTRRGQWFDRSVSTSTAFELNLERTNAQTC